MGQFSENLRRIRFELHMTQEEFATYLGTTKQNISRYESGQVSPKITTAQAIADKLGLSLSELNGRSRSSASAPFGKSIDGLIPRDQLRTRRVPILGDTAAGEPVIANRVYDEWVDIPDDGHHYDAALYVTGDSMTPRYQKGDLVFIRYQDDVEDGQIAVVCLDDSVTLKRVYHVPGGLTLLSDNPKYPPQNYTAADIANAHLVGLAVGVLHWDY